MPRPKSPPRVKLYSEPLPDGRLRYRVRLIDGSHLRDVIYWKQGDALAHKAMLEARLHRHTDRTVSEALCAWYKDKLERGSARASSCEKEQAKMRLVLAEYLDVDVASITTEQARAIYKGLVEQPTQKTGRPRAAASHRHYLRIMQSFFRWCVSQGDASKNPFAEVRPVGRVNRGKPQLRNEEVSRYISAGLKYYEETEDRLALAAAILPVFGLRVSEALTRQVRDIDRGKIWHLVIDEGLSEEGARITTLKTGSARRRLEIPPIFVPYLERLIANRNPNEYLFGAGRTGKRKVNGLLWSAVRRLCDRAEIPRVCPHSMRGYYASAGVRSGALPHVVAANMGHSSFGMTAKHYAEPQAIVDAHRERVMKMLNLDLPFAESAQPPAETLVEALSAALPISVLVRLTELLSTRLAARLPAGSEGSEFPPAIHSEYLSSHSNPVPSRQKN